MIIYNGLNELNRHFFIKYFFHADVQPSASKPTYWELKNVKFDGVPIKLIGTRVYGCHLGKDRNVQQKIKYHAEKQRQAVHSLSCIPITKLHSLKPHGTTLVPCHSEYVLHLH